MTARRLIIGDAMPSRDPNGRALPAKLRFYEPNTALDTVATVYTTSALNVAHSQPILSDANGRFPAIWADSADTFDVAYTDQVYDRNLGTFTNVSTLSDVAAAAMTQAEAAADAAEAAQAAAEAAEDAAVAATSSKADKTTTISGGGLATGGGSLAANRTITVTEASDPEAVAGSLGTVVMTPRRFKAGLKDTTFLAEGTTARSLASRFAEHVSVMDFGATGDGTTDDAPAIAAAIASGARRILFPKPAVSYLCATPIIDGDEMPSGIEFVALGRPETRANPADGVLIKWTQTGALFDIIEPNGTDERGHWTFRGFTFQATNVNGGIFSFNDPATVTPTDDNTTPNYLCFIAFKACMFWGGSNTVPRGNAVQATKCFEISVDDDCYFKGWKRAVWLKGCDNCQIGGRYSENGRHVHVQKSSTFGNDNRLAPTFLGPLCDGGEDSYLVWDSGTHTELVGPLLETTTGDALLYLDGDATVIYAPSFGADASVPGFELGSGLTDAVMIHPTTSLAAGFAAPVIASPSTWDWNGDGFNDHALTIISPNRWFADCLEPSPRIRIINPPAIGQIEPTRQPTNLAVRALGPTVRHVECSPLNWWGKSDGTGLEDIEGIVADAGGLQGLAIKLSTTNLSGFQLGMVAGEHFREGERVKATIWYRTSGIPGAGTVRGQFCEGSSVNDDFEIPATATYARFTRTYQLSGFATGDLLNFNVYNAGSDVNLYVAAILLQPVEAAIADISTVSADMSNAERVKFNSVLAALRAAGILAE